MSHSTSLPPAPTTSLSAGSGSPAFQRGPLLLAGIGLLVVAFMAWPFGGPRYVVAVAIGALAGFALYHAAFGFTGAGASRADGSLNRGLRAHLSAHRLRATG